MIRRRLWISLLGVVAVAVVLVGLNLGLGNTPVLGLDLQGGVSVILRPVGDASDDDLIVIRDLVRDQLENTGIAEPDVRVEGSNIIVDLPGVRDQEEALTAADVSGIVSFRPVYQCGLVPTTETTGSTEPAATTPGSDISVPDSTASTGSSAPGSDTTGPIAPPTTPVATPAGFGSSRARPAVPPPTTVAAADDADEAPPSSGLGTTVAASTPDTAVATIPDSLPPVPAPTEAAQQEILTALDGSQCVVGPSGGSGEIFTRNSATVEFGGQQGWVVDASLSGAGEASWNAIALQCFNGLDTCPSRQLAIVLDDIVQSAPEVQQPQFQGSVAITGMGESEARSLSRVINRGAFPVEVEPATVQTVSATLGKDSMRASILAGLVGIALVLVLLVVFYRYLTVLVLAGMAVWGLLVYSASAFISETTNFALTLAGVTGIIVSIGMTVDSYIVYFERLKDEVRHGRTLRNSSARSFKATWRTILAANLVSVIGAAVLFVLSVGSVRGFALYLGVTTVCDVIVLWFFTRPAVILLAGTGRLDRRNTFGLEARATERAGGVA